MQMKYKQTFNRWWFFSGQRNMIETRRARALNTIRVFPTSLLLLFYYDFYAILCVTIRHQHHQHHHLKYILQNSQSFDGFTIEIACTSRRKNYGKRALKMILNSKIDEYWSRCNAAVPFGHNRVFEIIEILRLVHRCLSLSRSPFLCTRVERHSNLFDLLIPLHRNEKPQNTCYGEYGVYTVHCTVDPSTLQTLNTAHWLCLPLLFTLLHDGQDDEVIDLCTEDYNFSWLYFSPFSVSQTQCEPRSTL